MDPETGDVYVRRLASFIRTNEKNLAEAGIVRRRPQRPPDVSAFNPLSWFSSDQPAAVAPLVLSIDTHHLFFILVQLEALGIAVGTLDVRVDSPSRPMSYINLFPDSSDKSETLSLASFRSSFSAVSGLSLGAGWWGRPEPPSFEAELKYIYSSFTKLPALSIGPPTRKVIAELAGEPPNENAIPMDAFKTLRSLDCVDIDPRTLLGWDLLAESLRSLRIRRSGLEDVTDIFVGAVVDDKARREGSTSRKRRRRIPRAGSTRNASSYFSRLPESVPEEEDTPTTPHPPDSPPPSTELSTFKWAFLKRLSLSDNALTFFPSTCTQYLTSLTHLDLSSNLLVSVPSNLSGLYNLTSLNLSDNMIDSVLGIYLNLGSVTTLNLSRNRLDSLCGLERLPALERVDLRENVIEESAEVGRLAVLPNIAEIWIEKNPFTEMEEFYRVTCFNYFWREGKSILLDGSPPGFYEKRGLSVPPPSQMSSSRPVSTAYSPPVVAVGHAHVHTPVPPPAPALQDHGSSPGTSPPSSQHVSPQIKPVGAVGVLNAKAKARKKNKRIVDLDMDSGDHSDGSSRSRTAHGHARTRSDGGGRVRRVKKEKEKALEDGKREDISSSQGKGKAWEPAATSFAVKGGPSQQPSAPSDTSATETIPRPRMSKHSRSRTEYLSSSPTVPTLSTIPISASPTGSSASPTTPTLSNSAAFRRSSAARNSATFSTKSSVRRTRVSASVYEPPSEDAEGGEGAELGSAAEYRKRIEALKKDMGDGWLKVFSQSQMRTPTPGG